MQVVLSWTASVTPNVYYYRIYRAAISGGPYTLIGTSNTDPLLGSNLPSGTTVPAALTTYTDISAPNGQNSYYVITAVTPDGEGPQSSQYTAVFPALPSAPTGITAIIT